MFEFGFTYEMTLLFYTVDLVEQCWAFIDNNDVFNEDTAFLLYMDAKEKNLPEVRELMLPRIQHFFLMLVSSQDWLELDLEDVKNILKSNYIRVNWYLQYYLVFNIQIYFVLLYIFDSHCTCIRLC